VGPKRFLEPLEDRNLLLGGVTPSLVALGGATPRPTPLPATLLPLTGTPVLNDRISTRISRGPPPRLRSSASSPAASPTSTAARGAAVFGDGTDWQGNTLYWAADVRFMKGTYCGVDGDFYKGTFVEV
jgi:hypothetical protein